MTKTKTVYRIVCAKQGNDRDHTTHAYSKNSLAKATQARIDADHHSEMVARTNSPGPGNYYLNEAPWRIETREIGEWTDVSDG